MGPGYPPRDRGDVLLLTPLAVAGQMVREAASSAWLPNNAPARPRSNRASPLPTTPSCITSICRALRA